MAASCTAPRAVRLALLAVLAAAGTACTSATISAPGGGAAGSIPASIPATAPGPARAGGAWPGPQPVPAALARTELAALPVAAAGSMAGYSRDKFPHWAAQGNSCDTREKVLARDGTGVRADAACRAVAGTWFSVYDNATITDSAKADADHLVPLANAWRSGAAQWTTEQRKAFANDLIHPQLLAVSASSNRAKGDQGPEAWKPPNRQIWCAYARAWTDVKTAYHLTVTTDEKSALNQMLDTCTTEAPR